MSGGFDPHVLGGRLAHPGVHANADAGRRAPAREFGAEGIGLCRTEHMFFETERIVAMREMILSEDEAARRAALAKLLPMQRDDFAELFRVMKGLPVTIRLLDPPLNEFLPTGDAEMADVAASAGIELERVKARVAQLHEMNPMLRHRGCRLAISYPEVCEMQARAMFERRSLRRRIRASGEARSDGADRDEPSSIF